MSWRWVTSDQKIERKRWNFEPLSSNRGQKTSIFHFRLVASRLLQKSWNSCHPRGKFKVGPKFNRIWFQILSVKSTNYYRYSLRKKTSISLWLQLQSLSRLEQFFFDIGTEIFVGKRIALDSWIGYNYWRSKFELQQLGFLVNPQWLPLIFPYKFQSQ
jgi:hypothetical protein